MTRLDLNVVLGKSFLHNLDFHLLQKYFKLRIETILCGKINKDQYAVGKNKLFKIVLQLHL